MKNRSLDARVRARISGQNAMFLDHRARQTGKSKSRIIDEALSASFSYEIDDERDARILERLDQMMRHNHRHSRDLNLHMESFSLFLQFFFTLSPEIPVIDQDARATRGVVLLNQYFDQLGAKMKSGGKTFKHALEDVLVSDEDFFRLDELKLLEKLQLNRIEHGQMTNEAPELEASDV